MRGQEVRTVYGKDSNKKRRLKILSEQTRITMTSLEDCVKKRKSDILKYLDDNIDETSES